MFGEVKECGELHRSLCLVPNDNLNCLGSLSTQALVCFPVGIIAHHNLKTCSEAVLYTREVSPLRYDFYLDDQGKKSSNTLWWEQGSQECRRGSGFVGEAFAVIFLDRRIYGECHRALTPALALLAVTKPCPCQPRDRSASRFGGWAGSKGQ